MDETSTNLTLPYLQAAQAQKHVTHNAALAQLDLVVQLVLQGVDETVPPLGPDEGQVWGIGTGAVGDWAGHDGALAAWSNGGWLFLTPRPGWQAMRGSAPLVFDGSDWVTPDLPALQNLPGVGVNTSHDGTNRLAVASAATLLTHEGAGHQLKVNKNAVGDTASLLFQTGFSGRAEMGTAGSDAFSVKVSPDGSSWATGLTLSTAGVAALLAGLTIDGKQAYHRGNVLGTVSQASGVPTGAVVERGSNTNGDYIRFADGTQICLQTLTVNMTIANAFMGGFRSNGQNWTYPATFSHWARMFAYAVGDSGFGAVAHTTPTNTTGRWAATAVTSQGAADRTVHLMAHGRWF